MSCGKAKFEYIYFFLVEAWKYTEKITTKTIDP